MSMSIRLSGGSVMKHLGLFEGIGGFSLAARWAGWETVAWCEWNDFGQRVLRHHFPDAEGHGDITKTDFRKYANRIDVITGGFPCQPYSSAGKRKGKEDERHLWPEMLRVIREVQPSYVVGENVRGLTNWNGGLVFDEVQADLEAEGYEVLPFLLPAASVNAPHKRDRIWFIAYSDRCADLRRSGKNESQGSEERLQERDSVWESDKSNGLRGVNSDTNVHGLQGDFSEPQARGDVNGSPTVTGWENYPSESPICRVDDGIPDRVDRVKAYGNAIVPQVAYEIFKVINKMSNQ